MPDNIVENKRLLDHVKLKEKGAGNFISSAAT
jgi:hypothetical protein